MKPISSFEMNRKLPSVQFESAFFNINIYQFFEDSIVNGRISNQNIFVKCNIESINLSSVKFCYICIQHSIAENSSQVTSLHISREKLRNFLCYIHKYIFSKMPLLRECSFEFPSHDDALLQMFVMMGIEADASVTKFLLLEGQQSKVSVRLVFSGGMYKNLVLFIHQNILSTELRLPFDVSIALQISATKQKNSLEDFISIYTDIGNKTVPVAHVSIDWNIEPQHREHYWNTTVKILHKYCLTPYQYWHFSLENKQCKYLRSIYALKSYIGINIGKVEELAVTWLYCFTSQCTYLGTMNKSKYDVLSHIEWESFDIEEELAMRLMQSEYTEVILIPSYIREGYAQQKNSIDSILDAQEYRKYNDSTKLDISHGEAMRHYVFELSQEYSEIWVHKDAFNLRER